MPSPSSPSASPPAPSSTEQERVLAPEAPAVTIDAEAAATKDAVTTNEAAAGAENADAAADNGGGGGALDLRSKALRPFVIISFSYLLFTITDGAIRMITLLHAYNQKFSALEVAIMFTLYETAGAVTNLVAGLVGAKWGIKTTLVVGLTLQIVAYGMLYAWDETWSKSSAIIFVTAAQMLAGVAKDLTKLGGKTVTKLVTPDEQESRLFKIVSLITGWKNSLKGVGYFLGSVLLDVSYNVALGVMIGLVLLAMPWAMFGLDPNLGRQTGKKNAKLRDIFVLDNTKLNLLSWARLFLFASRDFWFEVPLPFYLRSPSCDGLGTTMCDSMNLIGGSDNEDNTCNPGAECAELDAGLVGICENINAGGGCGGLGVGRPVVGAILGGYIILYGQVQSWTPQLVTGPLDQTPPNKLTEMLWGTINCLPTLVGGFVMTYSSVFRNETRDEAGMAAWLIAIIVSFAFIFAINSSVHSFLVVNYAASDKLAVSVGFYYMANAVGRLTGTIGSGLLYTYVGEDYGTYAGSDATAGMAACFFAGTVCSAVAVLITYFIDDQQRGLSCGKSIVCVKPMDEIEVEDDVDEEKEEVVDEDEDNHDDGGRINEIDDNGTKENDDEMQRRNDDGKHDKV